MKPLRTLALALALALHCAPSSTAGPFEPCSSALPCAGDLSCRAAAGDAGATLCTRACATILECPLPSTAGASRLCAVPSGMTAGVCLTHCAQDADCLPGTLCRAMTMNTGDSARVCVP